MHAQAKLQLLEAFYPQQTQGKHHHLLRYNQFDQPQHTYQLQQAYHRHPQLRNQQIQQLPMKVS